MSTSARYNLCINAGSTFNTTFVLRHKIVITEAAASGATTLNVSPIPHPLTSGDTLTFGTVTVTLSADAVIGDRTLSVSAISGAISKSATAKGDLVDLTNKLARASIRENYSDTTALASFTCTVNSPATKGEVVIELPSNTSIEANIEPQNADDIVDLQAVTFPTAEERKLFIAGKQPYKWDLEVYDSGSPPNVTRYINGQVLVVAEATK